MTIFLKANNLNEDQNLSLNEADEALLNETLNELKELESLNETKIIRIIRKETKDTRKRRLIARTAMMLAKQNGDPMYQKLKDTIMKVKALRSTIRKKYAGKAKSKAAEYARNVK